MRTNFFVDLLFVVRFQHLWPVHDLHNSLFCNSKGKQTFLIAQDLTAQLQIFFVEIISRYLGISLIENRFPVIFHTLKVLRIIQIICDCTAAVQLQPVSQSERLKSNC